MNTTAQKMRNLAGWFGLNGAKTAMDKDGMFKHGVVNEEMFIIYMLDTPPMAAGGLKRMQEIATQLATGAMRKENLLALSLWRKMDPIKVLELLARRECANTKPDQEVLEDQEAQHQ